MTGHLDLGHHPDVPLGGILDDVANVGRREIFGLAVDERADLRQLGISGDFQPPSFIIGQMELEDVELVRRHLVHDFEQRLLAEKVAALVDQEAAPAKPRRIVDLHVRNRAFEDQLPKRLRAVEQPARIRGFDRHTTARCPEMVGLGRRHSARRDDRKPDSRCAMASMFEAQFSR